MDIASQKLNKRIKKIAKYVGIGILFSAAILFVVFSSLKFSFFAISGDSMEPALSNGDSIIIKQTEGVSRGLLFFFNKPNTWNEYKETDHVLVKRIAAIGGDKVTYDGEAFYVNDEEIYNTKKENYECSAGNPDYEYIVQQNQILAFGDNAKESLDSRRIFCDGKEENMYLTKKNYLDYGELYKKF